ncbi:MAG: hypothetical protein DWQ10_12255, partial [Calditrichaeota bacterium]
MQKSTITVLFFGLIFIFLLVACGGVRSTLPLSSLESDGELLFVEGKTDLYKMNSRGGEIEKIMAMGRSIMNPVWSPNGESIAMFLMKDKDFDPFESDNPHADLIVLKFGGIEPQYLGPFEFRQEVDRNGWKFTSVTTPVWHPDSKKLFVHDKTGLQLVVPDDKTVPLIRNPEMETVDIALSKANVVYSVAKDLFAYNFRTRKSVEMAALRPSLRLALEKNINAVRFSPDENSLAVASGTNLVLIDIKTMRERIIHHARSTIYDLRWNPDGSQLAVLAGKYASYSPMGIGAAPGGKIPGKFTIT